MSSLSSTAADHGKEEQDPFLPPSIEHGCDDDRDLSVVVEEGMQERGRVAGSKRLSYGTVARYGLPVSLFCLLACILYIAVWRSRSVPAWIAGKGDKTLNVVSMDSLRSTLRTSSLHDAAGQTERWKGTQLAMFATGANLNFCKTLFSALANGYEPPHLIHFNKSLTHGNGEKVIHYRSYLHDAQVEADKLILLVDAFDVWFQLPEVVARQRFAGFSTDLLVGADKKCWPNQPTSKACVEWPESVLDKDVYGDYTDLARIKEANGVEYARPRWLNSGTLLGDQHSLEQLFAKASELASLKGSAKFSDQEVLADVLADGKLDFRFAVDSASQIFQTLTFSHQDMTWEVNPDPASAPSSPYRKGSEQDLARKVKLQHAHDLGLSGPDRQKSFWFNRPLLRNKIANSIPALLHFNGRKGFLAWWWKRMWFAQKATRQALLQTFHNEQSPGMAGAWDGENWLGWNELCGSIDLFA